MDLELLHNACKIETRIAFEEYKRQIEVRLFPFNNCLNENLKKQMVEQLYIGVTKIMFRQNLSIAQCEVVNNVLIKYRDLILKVSVNYSKSLS